MQSCDYFKQILELLSPYFQTPLVNGPATESEIQALESHIGHSLPDDLRAIYLMHNGEFRDLDYHADDVLIPMLMCGYVFTSLDEMASEYDMWAGIIRDEERFPDPFPAEYHGYPVDTIKAAYVDKGWIPFAKDGGGNCLAIDFSPDKRGTQGQVINFGRDDHDLFQIAKDFTGFLKFTLEMYQQKRFHYILDPEEKDNLIGFLHGSMKVDTGGATASKWPYGAKNREEAQKIWAENLERLPDTEEGEGFTITVGNEEPYHSNDPKELERLLNSDASSYSITIKTKNAVSHYSAGDPREMLGGIEKPRDDDK